MLSLMRLLGVSCYFLRPNNSSNNVFQTHKLNGGKPSAKGYKASGV